MFADCTTAVGWPICRQECQFGFVGLIRDAVVSLLALWYSSTPAVLKGFWAQVSERSLKITPKMPTNDLVNGTLNSLIKLTPNMKWAGNVILLILSLKFSMTSELFPTSHSLTFHPAPNRMWMPEAWQWFKMQRQQRRDPLSLKVTSVWSSWHSEWQTILIVSLRVGSAVTESA